MADIVAIGCIAFAAGWLARGAVTDALFRLILRIFAHDKGKEVILKKLVEITSKEPTP